MLRLGILGLALAIHFGNSTVRRHLLGPAGARFLVWRT
jgi:hypothetical protein